MSNPAPRLSFSTKLSYGLGSVAQGSAGAALAQGIIAYYLNLVLGLLNVAVATLGRIAG
jgi:Na+/melibiose symporter-like transporter